MCTIIWSIIQFSAEWHGYLSVVELAWHLAAVLILVKAALAMKRRFGAIRRRGDLRVALAFVPFVNWRSVVAEHDWPIVSRVNRRVRFVIVVYVVLALTDVVMLIGVNSCPPPSNYL